MKAIKSDSDSDSDEQKKEKKGCRVLRRREKKKPGMTPQNWQLKKVARFFRKNRGVTPSVAGPGVTPTLVTPLPSMPQSSYTQR